MTTKYAAGFKHWDPKSTELPIFYPDEFREIIRRAQILLEGKSSSSIIQLQKKIDKALSLVETEKNEAFIKKHPKDQTLDFITIRSCMRFAKKMNLFTYGSKQNQFTWPQHYAVLSLALTANAFPSNSFASFNQELLKLSDQEVENQQREFAYSLLRDSIELIDSAEEYEELRQKNAEGGKSQNSEKQELKYQFIVYFYNQSNQIVSQVAREFYENRPWMKLRLASEGPENIGRFFRDTLREFKNGNLELPSKYLDQLPENIRRLR